MKIPKINWKVKAVIALAVVAGCVFGGYRYYAQQQAQVMQKTAVTKTEVVRMDLKSVVSATGTITPANSVEVSPKITARITSVSVKENDEVKAGQVVATLDGKDYEAKRDQAKYKVANTEAKYNRISYLYSIGAKSEEELQNALYEYETARSSLISAESDVSNTIITAPMDGVVVGRPKSVGTMAAQGNSNPTVIMKIADLSTKQIEAKIDETDIGNIRDGQEAVFTVDAFTDKKFRARVTKIAQTDTGSSWDIGAGNSSSANSASVIYYYVTLDVEDPENILLPGMTARVEITTATRKNALAVPISVLKTDSNGSYVMLTDETGAEERRYVKTGIYSDEYVEILEGLEEGDTVVSSYNAGKKMEGMPGKAGKGGPPKG